MEKRYVDYVHFGWANECGLDGIHLMNDHKRLVCNDRRLGHVVHPNSINTCEQMTK